MAATTINLATPVELHGELITDVTIREPTGANYLDFGEPFVIVGAKGGGVFRAENDDAIRRYLGACVEHKAGAHLLRLMTLEDARAIKTALLDFFLASAPETSAS